MKMLIGILIFVLFPALAQADFYKWKDDAGKTHYADSIAKVPAQYRDQVQHKNTPEPKRIEKGSPAETVKIMDGLIAENKKKQTQNKRRIRELEREIQDIEEDGRRFRESIRNKAR